MVLTIWGPEYHPPGTRIVFHYRLRKRRYNTERNIRIILRRRLLQIRNKTITLRRVAIARWIAWIGCGPPALVQRQNRSRQQQAARA